MKYVIYKNQKSPTQSGLKRDNYWVLEDTSFSDYKEDMLTGWKGQKSIRKTRLKFGSKQEAINYATKNMLKIEVVEESTKSIKEKSYADNYKYKRIRTEF
jgi:hypothetical protein